MTYKTAAGKVANELLNCHDEPRIEVAELGRPRRFDGDGGLFGSCACQQRFHRVARSGGGTAKTGLVRQPMTDRIDRCSPS